VQKAKENKVSTARIEELKRKLDEERRNVRYQVAQNYKLNALRSTKRE